MIETMRGSVQTWECDANNHMNVQFYVMHAVDSLVVLGQALGLGPEYIRSEGAALIAHEHHIRYLRERRASDPIMIKTGVLKLDNDGLQLVQEMRSTDKNEVVASFITYCHLVDLNSRTKRVLPEFVKQKVQTLYCELPHYAAPRGIAVTQPRDNPRLQEADAMDLLYAYTGLVRQNDIDSYGYMHTTAYMAKVSDAVPVVIAALPGLVRNFEDGIGGAALEYRFIYRQTPRLGDILTMRSGLKAVAQKTYTWCHWLFDATSGDCVASAEAVVVSLDLKQRKAVPIPEAVRAQLAALVIPKLSV